jgi:hypothetical protein
MFNVRNGQIVDGRHTVPTLSDDVIWRRGRSYNAATPKFHGGCPAGRRTAGRRSFRWADGIILCNLGVELHLKIGDGANTGVLLDQDIGGTVAVRSIGQSGDL